MGHTFGNDYFKFHLIRRHIASMTPKHKERIKTKIKRIKLALSADKKLWCGFYIDGRWLRYIPPQLYLQLDDYSGGLRYFNWFTKNFPDDSCYLSFLLEWTIVLFKTRRLKEAEKMAFETFCSELTLINIFFGKQVIELNNPEDSNESRQEVANNHFLYASSQDNLLDFSEWLHKFVRTKRFILFGKKYIDSQKRLETESDYKKRHYVVDFAHQLLNDF